MQNPDRGLNAPIARDSAGPDNSGPTILSAPSKEAREEGGGRREVGGGRSKESPPFFLLPMHYALNDATVDIPGRAS
jgi:hypothetical protein